MHCFALVCSGFLAMMCYSSLKDSQEFKWIDDLTVLHTPGSFHLNSPTWMVSGVAKAMWWWVLEVDRYSGLELEGKEPHPTPS